MVRRNLTLGRRQAGLTLVELMVAAALGLLITGAAVATLLIARQGFLSADASSQLRENARYAAGLIERVAVESGFENAAYNDFAATRLPGLRGYDNALVSPALSTLPNGLAHDTRTASNCGTATLTACPTNQSDVLVIRFSGASRPGTPKVADQSVINCAGLAEPETAPNANPADPRAWSIFHVATGALAEADGEPSLACTYFDSANNKFTTRSIVKGVESFQVLYGVFGVTPGTCSVALTAANFAAQVVGGGGGDAPSRFLTAKQMDPTPGVYCANNWSRVRALRIGLLVRGDPSTTVARVAQPFKVLGKVYSDDFPTGGSILTAPADGRLRQSLVFTVYLRNSQF